MVHRARLRSFAFASLVVALLVLLGWRATLGISFFDDGHYAAAPYYYAQGGVPLADDMTVQSLGFLVSVPFARLWTLLFGTQGIVLALRLVYVVLAVACAALAFRLLRPTAGRAASLVAAAVPLLVPPYNVLAASYNTIAMLAHVLALALAVSALRTRSGRTAFLAGVALVAGAIAYPPLAAGAVLFGACFALWARERRLSLSVIAGASSAVVAFAAWLLAAPGIGAVRESLVYSSSMWAGIAGPTDRLATYAEKLRWALAFRQLAPAWILAALATVGVRVPRVRTLALALVPLAVAAPGLRYLALGIERRYFGANGPTYVVLLSVALIVPVAAWAVTRNNVSALQLLTLGVAASAAGYPIAAASTNSSFYAGVPVVGLAPLAVALVCVWAMAVRDSGAAWLQGAAGAALVGVLVVMLFARSYGDGPIALLDTRIRSGAAAGILASEERARAIASDEALGTRWVAADDRVLVVGSPLSYLLVGGRMFTNAVWLNVGPSDQATLDYFERKGAVPDVVFVARTLTRTEGGLEARAGTDPLLAWLLREYSLVEAGEHLVVYTRR